jgi:hypothetical protein
MTITKASLQDIHDRTNALVKHLRAVEKDRDDLLQALKSLAGVVGLGLEGAIHWTAHKEARALIARLESPHSVCQDPQSNDPK